MMEQLFKKGIKLTKKFLWNIDLFASSQLLRHRNQTNYSTLTGGCLSLFIMVLFCTVLIKDSISVFTKKQIIAQDSIYFVDDPTYTKFKLDSESKFMIGIGISGLDLTKSERYFDITLTTVTYQYGKLVNKKNEPLQPCKYQNWARINEIGAISYNNSGLNHFLCPTSDLAIELQGKYTSKQFKFLQLAVKKCQNQTDPTRPCASDAIVQSSQSYILNYYFMNTFSNSGDAEPLGQYLQDRNYFGFSFDSTSVNNLYITENLMSTDNSLFPWEDVQNKTIILVKQLAQAKSKVIIPDQYIGVYLRKSPYYIVSERSFKKIQDLLSAVGGLFGFALAFFFFMQFYTQASYEVSMGDKLFYYSSQSDLKSNRFNFFVFVAYLVYQFFKEYLGIQVQWQRMKTYYECRQQVKQQLDVSLLLNKITFLQKCMNIVFEEHQFRAIYLQQKPNVKQAENLRKNHGLNKIIHKKSKKINNTIQQQINAYKQKMVNRIKDNKQKQIHHRLTYSQRINRNCDEQEQEVSIPQNSNNQIELGQIITNLSIFDQPQLAQTDSKPNQQKDSQPSEKSKQLQTNQNQLQGLVGQNRSCLQFINIALEDLRKIEDQSKRGNILSQRIYNHLNTDITKEQVIILKCLLTILEHQPDAQSSTKDKVKLNQSKLLKNLIRLAINHEPDKENKPNRLQMVLQSNNRIKANEYL